MKIQKLGNPFMSWPSRNKKGGRKHAKDGKKSTALAELDAAAGQKVKSTFEKPFRTKFDLPNDESPPVVEADSSPSPQESPQQNHDVHQELYSPPCEQFQDQTATRFVPVDIASLPRHLKIPKAIVETGSLHSYRQALNDESVSAAQGCSMPSPLQQLLSLTDPMSWNILPKQHRELIINDLLCAAVCHHAGNINEDMAHASSGDSNKERPVFSFSYSVSEYDQSLMYSDNTFQRSTGLATLDWQDVITLDSSYTESTLFDGLQDDYSYGG